MRLGPFKREAGWWSQQSEQPTLITKCCSSSNCAGELCACPSVPACVQIVHLREYRLVLGTSLASRCCSILSSYPGVQTPLKSNRFLFSSPLSAFSHHARCCPLASFCNGRLAAPSHEHYWLSSRVSPTTTVHLTLDAFFLGLVEPRHGYSPLPLARSQHRPQSSGNGDA